MKKTQSVLMKAHSLQRDRHIDRQSQWNVTGANTDVLREGDGGGLLGDLVMPEPSPKVSETSLEKKREALQAVATHTGSGSGGTRQKTGVGVPGQGGRPCLGGLCVEGGACFSG